MHQIYNSMNLEEFLKHVVDKVKNEEYDYSDLAYELRNKGSINSLKVNSFVEIKSGIYAGKKATIININICENTCEVKISEDKYDNIIKVSVNDLKIDLTRHENVYILS